MEVVPKNRDNQKRILGPLSAAWQRTLARRRPGNGGRPQKQRQPKEDPGTIIRCMAENFGQETSRKWRSSPKTETTKRGSWDHYPLHGRELWPGDVQEMEVVPKNRDNQKRILGPLSAAWQ